MLSRCWVMLVVSSMYSPELASSFLIFTALIGAGATFVLILELQLELEMEIAGLNGVDDEQREIAGLNGVDKDLENVF